MCCQALQPLIIGPAENYEIVSGASFADFAQAEEKNDNASSPREQIVHLSARISSYSPSAHQGLL